MSKITLTFPEPVAGTLTVDSADPAAAPQLTDGSNILTLSFDTPKKPGDTVYAVIAPVELTSEQEVTITATGTTRETRPKTFPGKHFAEGHTTPISYSIPPVGPTTLRVSLPDTGKSTLGENITSFTLTAAEGVDLSGGGSNVLTFPVETAGNFDFVFDEFPEALAGQSVAVSYESENALLSGGSFVIPELIAGGTNTIATLSVPYLMEEDFSNLTEDFSLETSTKDLSGSGLPGWIAGNRSQGWKETCIALRSYSNAAGPYHSRLNSCKLTNIKDGKTVTISVTFNGDWKKNKSSSMSLTVGRATGTGIDDAINSSTPISLSDNSNASTTNIPTSHTVRIGDFTNAQFIAWKTAGKNGSWFNYDNVYLDNIKVSIANE